MTTFKYILMGLLITIPSVSFADNPDAETSINVRSSYNSAITTYNAAPEKSVQIVLPREFTMWRCERSAVSVHENHYVVSINCEQKNGTSVGAHITCSRSEADADLSSFSIRANKSKFVMFKLECLTEVNASTQKSSSREKA